jgi:hypothetical protein
MKLVKESISFQRGEDPKNTLGIGTRHLIEKWLNEMHITRYIINDDMTIDIKFNVIIYKKNLSLLPEYIQFNKIRDSFICRENQLTSLKGCPKIVGNVFSCSGNQLTSLEGCPRVVKHHFICHSNKREFSEKEVRKYCRVGGHVIW